MIKYINFLISLPEGEYESLVLDCPMFSKRLKINRSRIDMENECTGKLVVEDAELAEK